MPDKSWKEMKIRYMNRSFKEKADQWKKLDVYDDRAVYVNMFHMIMRALDSLPDEPDVFVAVAVNNHIRENIEIMKQILERFEDR